MDLKIITKNNVGIIATLILVILLSQSRCFNFLIETPLGRMFLLAMTIFISYTNKIFGLLAVIFIIIAFNLNKFINFEGFDIMEGITTRKKTKKIPLKYCVKGKGCYTSRAAYERAMAKEDMEQQAMDEQDIDEQDIDQQDIDQQDIDEQEMETFITTSSSALANSREGFCMCDRELNILRGKSSNTVPVFSNSREQSDEVDPSDKSVFSSDYAAI
jgi:hypothetical protein